MSLSLKKRYWEWTMKAVPRTLAPLQFRLNTSPFSIMHALLVPLDFLIKFRTLLVSIDFFFSITVLYYVELLLLNLLLLSHCRNTCSPSLLEKRRCGWSDAMQSIGCRTACSPTTSKLVSDDTSSTNGRRTEAWRRTRWSETSPTT